MIIRMKSVLMAGLLALPLLAADDPSNRVAVLIDGSASFRSRAGEAVARAVTLLEGMAGRKLHRWDSAEDRIFIVSVDALPEVIWEGILAELKAADPAEWTRRFHARSDYARCTDITAAFQLAADKVQGDPHLVSQYVIAFTDLIDEPPTRSVSACAAPNPAPGEGFPWAALRDASVSLFWVPADSVLLWRRAVAERGVGAHFQVHSTSESAAVTLPVPQVAVEHRSEAERQAVRAKVNSAAGLVVKVVVWGIVGIMGLSLLAMFLQRRNGARGPSAAAKSS
jgi:hypothetical protein